MKCPIKYDTPQILAASEKGGLLLDEVCNHIIEVLCSCSAFVGTVFRHVRSRGGNQEDGEDLLQDGLTQLMMSLVDKKYKGNSSIENYAFGICKNLWMTESKNNNTEELGITPVQAKFNDQFRNFKFAFVK